MLIPALYLSTISVASPMGTAMRIGKPIAIDSNILEGITVLKRGESFR